MGDTLNVSIGQYETKVTPLQLAMNVSALGTRGKIRRPHLVNSWLLPNGEEVTVEPVELGDLGIAREHLDAVVDCMVGVVHDARVGTAHHSFVNDVQVTKWPLANPTAEIESGDIEELIFAGKTGTAEYGEQDPIGSEQAGARDSHGWFTCFAPADEPEVAISVVIEAGGEGTTYAVPVADEILRAWMELTGRRERGLVLSKDPLPVTVAGSGSGTPVATPVATPSIEYSPDGT